MVLSVVKINKNSGLLRVADGHACTPLPPPTPPHKNVKPTSPHPHFVGSEKIINHYLCSQVGCGDNTT